MHYKTITITILLPPLLFFSPGSGNMFDKRLSFLNFAGGGGGGGGVKACNNHMFTPIS